MVPHFNGVDDAVPVRDSGLAFQEVVDAGAVRAAVRRGLRVAECFNVIAFFRVRREL